MKLRLLSMAFLALAGTAFFTNSAKADAYTQGDLVLGFTQQGGANDFVIDLGQASTFATATGTINVTGLGNFSADLASAFGSGYATDSTVEMGIFGDTGLTASEGYSKGTLFESSALVGGVSLAPVGESYGGQNLSQSAFGTFTVDFFNNDLPTANSSGSIESSSSAESFAAGNPPPGVLGAFKTGFDIDASPSTTNELSLYATEPTTSGGNGQTTDLGYFTVSGNSVTFTSSATAAVPEPSTYAMVLVGGLALAFAGRRLRRS